MVPLHAVSVLLEIIGFGFTVTVIEKGVPIHVPAIGVTVYITF